jgi:hypothetical protein
VPRALHEAIFAKMIASSGGMVNSTPEVIDILHAPGVVAALDLLAGRDWAIVPFCHAFFASGGGDQCWRKDTRDLCQALFRMDIFKCPRTV